jgi:hypothetical protein
LANISGSLPFVLSLLFILTTYLKLASRSRILLPCSLFTFFVDCYHDRHLHDHFRILFESALSTEKNSVLNYDSRERNVPMESM